MLDLVGKRLGQYEVLEEIGRGGMAIVYRAAQPALNRHVALKILPPQLAFDQEFVARFQREAISAAGLHHPNIVVIHDVGGQDGLYYIVMELLHGTNLGALVQAEGSMPMPRVLTLMRQMGSALDHAHRQNLIHRDIKPTNIMVGENDHVTLMDFGVARAGERGGLTRTGVIVGTPDYMSPEQAQGLEVDHRTDIYSLGVVLYEMLTGHVPFRRTTPHAVLLAHIAEAPPPLQVSSGALPPAVEAVVRRALAKKPEDRYQSAGALAADLARAVEGPFPLEATVVPGAVVTPGAVTVVSAGATPPVAPPAPPSAAASGPTAGRRAPGWLWPVAGVVVFLALLAGAALLGSSFGLFAGPAAPTATPTAPVVVVVPTDTATPAPPTDTPTTAPSATATVADTPTRAPSATRTPSPEATETPAESATPAGTRTATATATRAVTLTPSVTRVPTTPPATRTATTGAPPGNATVAPPAALFNMETFGTWRRGDEQNGTFTQSSEQQHTGSFSGKLAYQFVGGNDYVVFINVRAISGQPNWLGTWVYGDGSGHFLNAWIQDARGEVLSIPLGRVWHNGTWQQMSGTIAAGLAWPGGHISGEDNGAIDYPISFYGFVYDPAAPATSTIYIDDVQAGTVNTPPPTAAPPTSTAGASSYNAPTLIAPTTGTVFNGQTAPILLQWNSVGALAPGECYKIRIPHSDDPNFITECIYATYYGVPTWLFDYRFDDRHFGWQVGVFDAAGQPRSPWSDLWVFYWYGG